MSKIDPFELPEESEETGGEAECPSCGVIPSLDGATPGCNDPMGCGVGRDSDPDLEEESTEKDAEDPWEDYEEEELDFE